MLEIKSRHLTWGGPLCDYLAKYKRIAQSETTTNRNFTLCKFSLETKNTHKVSYL